MSRKKRTGVAICTVWALTDHEGHARVLLEEAANERKLHVRLSQSPFLWESSGAENGLFAPAAR